MIIIFFLRLFNLTVLKGSYYRFIAENNRIREIVIEGKRGDIYDRKGYVLVRSTPLENSKEEEIEKYTRTYIYGEAFGHIIGYRSIASKKDIKEDACSEELILNDKVGVKGIEKLYECHLRPQKGKKLIEVDAHGKLVKTLSKVPPKSGNPIRLSLDKELQEKAFSVISNNSIQTSVEIELREKKISIVGLDPYTGEVLILLSYPSFNPQIFEDNKQKEIKQYLEDKENPLFNRALLGTYPPGSVFKPVIAAGALEEKVMTPEDIIVDKGEIEAGPIKFRNWFYTQYGRTDGPVNMIKGLQRSNDIYFYKTGEKLTAPKIKKWAEIFGYGKKTNIGLDEEVGLVPSDFWKRETIGDRWFLGDTYNTSIGQGYLLSTPLQVALSTMPFANSGKICTPQLLKLGAEENKGLVEEKPQCRSLNLSRETLSTIREGMKKACESGGTGWPFFDFKVKDPLLQKESTTSAQTLKRIEVGCKTGTAESHKESGLPHAWFTVFAPFDKPEIVLTVMVEEAGEGSYIAAPIAKEILKMYFERSE